MSQSAIGRRAFARLGAAAFGVAALGTGMAAQQREGAAPAAAPAVPAPDTLKTMLLMDLVLETAMPVTMGSRTAIGIVGGTFEGPMLRGKIAGPGADWPVAVNPTTRRLDGRATLVTDDDQRIYMTYDGVLYTPPTGQGERYWRAVPVFRTDSAKYEWLNRIVAVGVNYTVPQRIGYRIFQVL